MNHSNNSSYSNNDFLSSLTQPSEEEEIVDLMLKKICSLFGIRYQVTKDTLGPDMNSSSGLTFNNSHNFPKNSLVDVNNIQTSDILVNP